jgi:hypothetical protein
VQFALADDAAMTMSQWTDDIVLLPPAGPIQRGRNVIAEAFTVSRPPNPFMRNEIHPETAWCCDPQTW